MVSIISSSLLQGCEYCLKTGGTQNKPSRCEGRSHMPHPHIKQAFKTLPACTVSSEICRPALPKNHFVDQNTPSTCKVQGIHHQQPSYKHLGNYSTQSLRLHQASSQNKVLSTPQSCYFETQPCTSGFYGNFSLQSFPRRFRGEDDFPDGGIQGRCKCEAFQWHAPFQTLGHGECELIQKIPIRIDQNQSGGFLSSMQPLL